MDGWIWAAASQALDLAARRRLVRQSILMWSLLALGTILFVTVIAIWHLIRRGRLIRDRLGPPRVVLLPELKPADPEGPSDREISEVER